MFDKIMAFLVITILLILLINNYIAPKIEKGYNNWIQWELRPVIHSEVNKILCNRGLSWDCSNINDSTKIERERRLLNGRN